MSDRQTSSSARAASAAAVISTARPSRAFSRPRAITRTTGTPRPAASRAARHSRSAGDPRIRHFHRSKTPAGSNTFAYTSTSAARTRHVRRPFPVFTNVARPSDSRRNQSGAGSQRIAASSASEPTQRASDDPRAPGDGARQVSEPDPVALMPMLGSRSLDRDSLSDRRSTTSNAANSLPDFTSTRRSTTGTMPANVISCRPPATCRRRSVHCA